MVRIDPRWLRAARLAGATLVAVGALDVVLRGSSLSRNEDGAILLAAGVALLALHVVLSRRGGRDSTDALLAAALAVPFVPVGVALLVVLAPVRRLALHVRRRPPLAVPRRGVRRASSWPRSPSPGLRADPASALGARGRARDRIRSRASERGARPDLLRIRRLVDAGAHHRRRRGGRTRLRVEGPRGARTAEPGVAAAIMLAAAAEARAFGGSRQRTAVTSSSLGLLAAQVAIAWWRATPGIAVAIIVTGGILSCRSRTARATSAWPILSSASRSPAGRRF